MATQFKPNSLLDQWLTIQNQGADLSGSYGDGSGPETEWLKLLQGNNMDGLWDTARTMGYTGNMPVDQSGGGDSAVYQPGDPRQELMDWMRTSGNSYAVNPTFNGGQENAWLDPQGQEVAGTRREFEAPDDSEFWGAALAAGGLLGGAAAGGLGNIGAGYGLSGNAALGAGGATVGAGVGGFNAAVEGENILKGALKGGAIGGIGAYGGGLLNDAISPYVPDSVRGFFSEPAATGDFQPIQQMEVPQFNPDDLFQGLADPTAALQQLPDMASVSQMPTPGFNSFGAEPGLGSQFNTMTGQFDAPAFNPSMDQFTGGATGAAPSMPNMPPSGFAGDSVTVNSGNPFDPMPQFNAPPGAAGQFDLTNPIGGFPGTDGGGFDPSMTRFLPPSVPQVSGGSQPPAQQQPAQQPPAPAPAPDPSFRPSDNYGDGMTGNQTSAFDNTLAVTGSTGLAAGAAGLVGGVGSIVDGLGGLKTILPVLGAIEGAKKTDGGTSTTQSRTDPRMDEFIYGAKGIPAMARDRYNANPSGLNDTMRAGLDMKRGLLSDPKLMQDINSFRSQGLLASQAPVAGNPFTSGQMRLPSGGQGLLQGFGSQPPGMMAGGPGGLQGSPPMQQPGAQSPQFAGGGGTFNTDYRSPEDMLRRRAMPTTPFGWRG